MTEYFAPAKINLFLHIVGRRDNGYHELESLVCFTDVGDKLFIEPSSQLELDISGPFSDALQEDKDNNLVMKAARLFRHKTCIDLKLKITLEKNLPLASGIGGGSSDAAATLRGLNHYCKTGILPQTLREWGLALGADVPMCVLQRPAFIQGIGEVVTLLKEFPELFMVLANPGIAVATPNVFKVWREKGQSFTPQKTASFKVPESDVVCWLRSLHNDLTTSAQELCPVITEVLDVLGKSKGCQLTRLSGSGATCFGVFETKSSAEQAAYRLQQQHPTWWVRKTSLLHSPLDICGEEFF